MEITPNYYNKFKCIDEKCEHNCCIGWEIDIDDETLAKYQSIDSDFGKRIRANIEGEEAHFVLKEADRCPFLNDCNLCDIISSLGEDYLCDICTLHPRFRNFYCNFIETGLGLCCEEAVRIVLLQNEKFELQVPDDIELLDEEKDLLELRQKCFDVMQNRESNVRERFEKLARMFDFDFSYSLKNMVDTYLSLERLDEKWSDLLLPLKNFDFDECIFENPAFSTFFEQLSCYFVFRHFNVDDDITATVNFVLMSCYVIGALLSCQNVKMCDEKALDIVRMYSSEIEYSLDNMDSLLYGNNIE